MDSSRDPGSPALTDASYAEVHEGASGVEKGSAVPADSARESVPAISAHSEHFPGARFAAIVAAVLLFVAVVRMGWVSDDSFIVIRSVDHLVHGKGFLINLGERVQSFTSPLWALFTIPAFAATHNPYASLIGPGLVATLATCAVVLGELRDTPWNAAVVLLAFAASSSFVQFSTSGLENSLAHLLLVSLVFERLRNGREATRSFFVLAGGLFLTRFDYALLVAPSLLLVVAKDPKRALRLAAPALAVVCAWFAFATIYYGFPFPNTAYAKLNTSIPLDQRFAQGVSYLVDSACRDPIVLLTLLVAAVLALRRGAPPVARALFLGVGAYVLYLLYVGGDFMSGRFLTAPYVASLVLVVYLAAPLHRWLPRTAAALLAFLAIGGLSDRRANPHGVECVVPESGIVDERECYVEYTGLAQNVRLQKWKKHPYMKEFEDAARDTSDHVLAFNLAGMVSYANVEERHLVEGFGLTEPLLARIRFAPDPNWRIGHFLRELPDGYLDTLRSGTNVIVDPCLHDLYDRLFLVTHGPLWSLARLRAIWSVNTTRGTCRAP